MNTLAEGGDDPEPMGILLDTSYVKNKPIEPVNTDWWLIENEKLFRQQAAQNGAEYITSNITRNEQIDVLLTLESGEYIAYDCERFMNFEGTKFVVEEGVYPDFASASNRMQFLASKSLVANVFKPKLLFQKINKIHSIFQSTIQYWE